MQTDPWVNKLKIGFYGLEATRKELGRKKQELDTLRGMASELLSEFRKTFPPGSTSLYLPRSPDRSHTALRWRLSSMMGQDISTKRIELYSNEGLKLLRLMPPETQTLWQRFEYRRMHLNYALAVANYNVDRLQALLEFYVALEENKV